MSFIQEFKEFAMKGNALDLAVGIILGTAFNKLVDSIVNDLVMPPIGLLIAGVDFKDMEFVLKAGLTAADGKVIPAVTIKIGAFLNQGIQFMIIALTVFFIVKFMTRLAQLKLEIPKLERKSE
jgi:large conductance mechanosensitive channel